MKRNIEKLLNKWKNNPLRKPLILTGARQIGKTYIVNKFAKNHYQNIINVNFEKNTDVHAFFEGNIEPKEIIRNLEIYFNIRIIPGSTLIFFDEVQAYPPAITSLKYFYEEANDYHIIAAGSLLGVALNRKFNRNSFSYPVGKVDELRMYPMNFEEFLIALDEDNLINSIEESYEINKPLNDSIHQKALRLYCIYLTIGGMPEAVSLYLKEKSLLLSSHVAERIYQDYLKDTSKYVSLTEGIKNKACYDSIVSQLLKENKSFKYSNVEKGKSSQYFGSSIEWLINAGLAFKSSLLKTPRLPLVAHIDEFLFRFYLNDVGLFRYKAGLKLSNISNPFYRDDITGVLAENYVATELSSYNILLYYWKGKALAEIDFMVEYHNEVCPLEVKAGVRVTSNSLNSYKNNYRVNTSFRVSMKNFGFENNIKSVPLYAVFCLAKDLSNQR